MFLDIGIGILLSIWTSGFFRANLTSALLCWGIIFVLVPDLDFVVELIRHGRVGGKVIGEHRELGHFPFLYVPVILIVFAIFGAQYGVLLSFGLLAHFLHDSVGIGWGIQWFWPVSKKIV